VYHMCTTAVHVHQAPEGAPLRPESLLAGVLGSNQIRLYDNGQWKCIAFRVMPDFLGMHWWMGCWLVAALVALPVLPVR
jgi:hypothetical protein